MATVVNQERNVQSDTWSEATYAWEDAGSRSWGDQRVLTNQTKNTATLTNQAKN